MKSKLIGFIAALASVLTLGFCCSAAISSVRAENAVNNEEKPLFSVEGSGEALGYIHSDIYGTDEYQFRLEKGGVVNYNQPVDLSECTSTQSFLQMRIQAEEKLKTHVKRISVILTDVYNPDNVVTLEGIGYTSGDANYYSYWKAGAKNQILVGVEKKNNGADVIHSGDGYGALTRIKFGYNTPEASVGAYYFDYANKTVYCNDLQSGDAPVFVCDLTDTAYHAVPWEGFTTGEVYLSVRLDELQTGYEDASISLISVLNKTFDGSETVKDERAPQIVVDKENYAESGAVGYPFYIYNATAYDAFSGIFSPKIKLYKNYGTEAQEEIALDNEDFFVPKSAGEYTLLYSAIDGAGNEGKETVSFSVYPNAHDITYKVLTSGKTNVSVGETVRLSAVEIGGGHGTLTCNCMVIGENGKFYNVEDNSFIPDRAGKYTVRYSVEDGIAQKSVYEYIVEATDDKPFIRTDDLLPDFIIKGYRYTLPKASAYDYKNDKEVPVLITAQGATIDGSSYTADPSAGEVRLKFAAADSVEEAVIPVVDIFNAEGNLDLTKYFECSQGASVQVNGVGVKIAFDGNGSAKLRTPFLTADTEMAFSVDTPSFDIVFSDCRYPDRKIKITYKDGKLQTGKAEYSVGTLSGDATFRFDDTGKIFMINGREITFDSFTNGEAFNGFSYNKAFVSFVAESGSVTVKKIDLQEMNSSITEDSIRPKAVISDNYGGYYDIGDKYKLAPVYFYDVLDTSLSCSLTVTSPSGAVVKDIDGRPLDGVSVNKVYHFIFSEYGSYRVRYSGEAYSGTRNFTYVLQVVDIQAPDIVLSSDIQKIDAKAGEEVALPTAAATDAVDGEVQVRLYLKNSDGMYIPFEDETNQAIKSPHIVNGKFIPQSKGRYFIVYYAMDKAGNPAFREICVEVK